MLADLISYTKHTHAILCRRDEGKPNLQFLLMSQPEKDFLVELSFQVLPNGTLSVQGSVGLSEKYLP